MKEKIKRADLVIGKAKLLQILKEHLGEEFKDLKISELNILGFEKDDLTKEEAEHYDLNYNLSKTKDVESNNLWLNDFKIKEIEFKLSLGY